MATLFRLAVTRSHGEIVAALGLAYAGAIHRDCSSGYGCDQTQAAAPRRKRRVARLVLDVRAVEKPADPDAEVGSLTAQNLFRRLFRASNRGQLKAARRARDTLLRIRAIRWWAIPDAQTIRDRIPEERGSFFRFREAPPAGGVVVEPANTRAERALRPLVRFRRTRQETRCEAARRWWERMWSVKRTLAQRGRSLSGFLVGALRVTAAGLTPPSVLAAAAWWRERSGRDGTLTINPRRTPAPAATPSAPAPTRRPRRRRRAS